MKRLTTSEIRQLWNDYFGELHHEIVPSSSLVPDDPTLLFANSGMVQFKDTFVGVEKRPYTRAATIQKCMRVSGKHNDLEEVGPSPRHHTFFEMLGNFSFGDYFKEQAIQWAWHLLVDELELPVERLWFSIHESDDESERLWQQVGAAPERVLRFGDKDNWWSMGDVGPCGPNSEIHYYWGDLDEQRADGVNRDDEYLEIYNLVFMQYEQKADGTRVPLPKPGVDTGLGLERLASVLQGTDNNYDTDGFQPIMDRIQEITGQDDDLRAANLYRYRAIADHARAVTFLISDGVLPGNEGRSYITRLVLRRAARFGKLLGLDEPFLAQVADAVIDEMGGHYSDIRERRNFILGTITAEEERFHRTLSTGLNLLDDLMTRLRADGENTIPGDEAFTLWDTYGFPIDLTRDLAEEHGFALDEAGFREALAAQKEQSRAGAQSMATGDVSVYGDLLTDLQRRNLLGEEGVNHLIYEDVAEADTQIIGLIVDGASVAEAHAGQAVEVVLPETPFYVESGGQVSDTGEIYFWPEDVDEPLFAVRVDAMRRPIPGLIVHIGEVVGGTVRVGDEALAAIDTERRWDVMRNHTATHVLHAALRSRLGTHVHQAGSLVAPDRLRFDFTHSEPLAAEELRDLEAMAGDVILHNYPVNTRVTSQKRAVAEGAMALFGEKYGNEVRVVSFGEESLETWGIGGPDPDGDGPVSMELCGGTHVDMTAEIGGFRVIGTGSVGAGVRRLEVATGRAAQKLVDERLASLQRLAEQLRTQPDQLEAAVENLQSQNRELQRDLDQARTQAARDTSASLLDRAVVVGKDSGGGNGSGANVLAVQVDAPDVDTLRQMTDWFRDKLGSSVVVVGSVINEKPMLVAAATEDLIGRGMHAGNLVRDTAKLIGGGGGGRPNMAQAGGRDASKLDEALASVPGWVEEHLK